MLQTTPGPWLLGPPPSPDDTHGMRAILVDKKAPNVIARVSTWDKHHEANAHLIALAPEMLAALETLETAAATDGWPDGWGLVRDRARAVIAKVEGQ